MLGQIQDVNSLKNHPRSRADTSDHCHEGLAYTLKTIGLVIKFVHVHKYMYMYVCCIQDKHVGF